MGLSKADIERYSRHLTLDEIGITGQEKLKNSSVLAVGCGGLGSPLLLYLAAAGVGKIGIVDFDVVDVSNLQRQIIHDEDWLNKSKTESARHRIHKLNRSCEVVTYDLQLNPENALQILKEYDVICDGTDNFPTRYLVNDSCVLLNKPYIYGSILKFEGQASVFNYKDTSPNYRDLVPEPPPPGLVPSCAEGGVMGILPGIIGTIQATETIKVLTGIGKPLDGRLLVFNALEMTFKEMKLKKQSNYKIEKLIDYKNMCSNSNKEQTPVETIKCKDLHRLIESQETVLIIDVRTKRERDICLIEPSLHSCLDDLADQTELDKVEKASQGSKMIILYCKMGGRSEKAARLLEKNNIKSYSLEGGILQWANEIDQTMNKY